MRAAAFLLFAAVAAATAGCGDYARSRVHGKVTAGGKPVAVGSVIFLGRDNMTYLADLKPDGTYEVAGVPRGTVRVSIQQPPPRPTPRPNPPAGWGGDKGKLADPVDDKAKASRLEAVPPPPAPKAAGPAIPAKYADPNASGLTFELTEPDQEWSVDLKP
ncbi:MAG: hypothetical protein K2X87_12260 [Gemmataceae bacterium]|nr:hypothetical protein [Gemmataceae bacterium]